MVAGDENEGRFDAVRPRRHRLCTGAASASTERGTAHDDIRGGSAGSWARTRPIRCANCSRTVACRAGPLLRSAWSFNEDRAAAAMFYYGYLAAKAGIHIIDISQSTAMSAR